MKKITTLLVVLALLVAVPAIAQESMSQDEAVAYLKTYDLGQSRKALIQLEKDLVETAYGSAERAALEAKLVALLAGEATPDAKRWICRQLVSTGTEQAVAALAAALRDPEVASQATWALSTMPAAAAGEALANALAVLEGRYLVGAIQALGHRGDTVPLLAFLEATEDAALKAEAVTALAKSADAGLCGQLSGMRPASDGVLRAALDDACLRCAATMAKAGSMDQAVIVYQTLLAEENPAHIRAAALSGWAAIDAEKALDTVMEALDSTSSDYSLVALGVVRELPGEAISEQLAARLAGLPPETQGQMVSVLADRGDPVAGPAILALVTSDEDGVALAALDAIAVLGDESAVPVLVETAAHGAGKRYRAARATLTKLADRSVNGVLIEVAETGDNDLRVEAVRALAGRQATEARSTMVALAAMPDKAVREAALEALESLGGEQDLALLFGLVAKAENEDALEGAMAAAVAIAKRIEDEEQRVAPFLAQLEAVATPPLKAAFIEAVGQIPTARGCEALRRYLENDQPAVRLAAIGQLGYWPTAVPVLDDLWGIVDAPKTPEEGTLAFEGCLRLIRTGPDLSPVDRLAGYERALGVAASAAARKQILAGLGQLRLLDALGLARTQLGDEEVAGEARFAVLNIARNISGAFPEEARLALQALADLDDEDMGKQAHQALELMACAATYITAWECAGPYFEQGKTSQSLYDMALPPEDASAEVDWQIAPLSQKPDACWSVDLAGLLGGNERVAYLRSNVWSPVAQDPVIRLGTNDGCKLWANGALLHGVNAGRPLTRDQDKVRVHLNEGWNTILLAVYQQGGQWGAGARIAKVEGGPVEGLKYAVGNPSK